MRLAARFHILAALIVSLALSLATAAPASATCKHRNLQLSTSNLAKVRSAVRCLVNRERSSRAIAKLKYSSTLATAAQRHSKSMVSTHFFDHVAPNGSTPKSRASAAGYSGSLIGENIAWGSGSQATPRQTVINWMNSPGHRRNILDPSFRYWGVGVARGGPRNRLGATYVTTFGGGR